jgi:hypothetical protein
MPFNGSTTTRHPGRCQTDVWLVGAPGAPGPRVRIVHEVLVPYVGVFYQEAWSYELNSWLLQPIPVNFNVQDLGDLLLPLPQHAPIIAVVILSSILISNPPYAAPFFFGWLALWRHHIIMQPPPPIILTHHRHVRQGGARYETPVNGEPTPIPNGIEWSIQIQNYWQFF